jgi:hypothetical protein
MKARLPFERTYRDTAERQAELMPRHPTGQALGLLDQVVVEMGQDRLEASAEAGAV